MSKIWEEQSELLEATVEAVREFVQQLRSLNQTIAGFQSDIERWREESSY